MGIISFILLGITVGAIAKTIWKGNEPRGVLDAMLVGVAGSVLGGVIASAAGVGAIGSFFSLGTWLIAIGGALVFLFTFDMLVSRYDRDRAAAN
jgi:uncharacterized membrane protein YeaQ/YmgE (transglycosylase-associated protein family)